VFNIFFVVSASTFVSYSSHGPNFDSESYFTNIASFLVVSGIGNTLTKLNIETYADEQLIWFGKTYLIETEIYRLGAYSYLKSHKYEIRQKQRTKYNNDFDSRDKRKSK
jgi:hypothetical protein